MGLLCAFLTPFLPLIGLLPSSALSLCAPLSFHSFKQSFSSHLQSFSDSFKFERPPNNCLFIHPFSTMIASKSLFVTFTAVAAVSAYVVPRTQPPNGWWTEGMEDYNSYHTRYLALGCQNQHGKPFFDSCCHPLKANETLETARPPECVPSWSSAMSACAAEPTSTVTTPDDDTSASVTASVSASPATSSVADVSVTTSASVAATPSPVSNVATNPNNGDDDEETCDADGEDEEDDEDGDQEFCDEDDDDDDDTSSSVVPTSTAASESTSAPAPTSTSAQSDGDDDEGDDEDEDCDEDGEDEDPTSSAVPSSSAAPGTTESAAPEPTSEPVVNPAPAPSSSEVASSTSEAVFTTSEVASSTSEAPTPTSSPTFSPESTRKHSSSKSSSAAESTPTSDSSSQVFTDGVATFFFQNNTPGACGDVHSDDDLIAAIDSARYGNTGERSDLCGKQVKITNTKNNKEVTVTIADACPTCENGDSIDLSAGAFDKIADRSEGVVPISWSFV